MFGTSVNLISTTDISGYRICVSGNPVYILAFRSFLTQTIQVIKLKVTHETPLQALRGDGGIAPTDSQPGNRRRLMVSTKLLTFHTQRKIKCPSYRRVGELWGRSGRHGNFHSLRGIRSPYCPVRSESVEIVRHLK
jgi:hypothetical protein